MSAIVLFIAQIPFAFSPLVSDKVADVINTLPFQIKENMVNHKKMVHPPCAVAA